MLKTVKYLRIKKIINSKKIYFLFICIGIISGCSTNYSCGQFPDSQCSPVSATYDSTNIGYYDYRDELYDENKRDKVKKSELDKEYSNRSDSVNRLSVAESGDPILTKPVYMRWLFNDWVDKDKNLHSGGYFYVKLKESKWITAK